MKGSVPRGCELGCLGHPLGLWLSGAHGQCLCSSDSACGLSQRGADDTTVASSHTSGPRDSEVVWSVRAA